MAHDHGVTTLQIGEAAVLAERLGCPVVADFRQNDIAAGGCGAPLVPIVDRWLLARPGVSVLALNIGGITNLTALPPREAAAATLIGFDCGPGNMVLDELARRRSNGAESCDRDGRLAAAGTVDAALLGELLAAPALAAPPPRSFGSEQYGAAFCDALLARRPPSDEQGVVRPVRHGDRAHRAGRGDGLPAVRAAVAGRVRGGGERRWRAQSRDDAPARRRRSRRPRW